MDDLDYEPEVDQEEDEDMAEDTARRAKMRQKGRGHRAQDNMEDRFEGRGGVFESVGGDGGSAIAGQRSVEGWVVIASNIHEEAQEDDVLDAFSEYGNVQNLHMNLDRRTGFVKGYALIEYEKGAGASKAIKDMNGKELLGQEIAVDWAFVKPAGGGRGGGGGRGRRRYNR
ncbi:unnamed protein product [Chrysoparadoxa australica]